MATSSCIRVAGSLEVDELKTLKLGEVDKHRQLASEVGLRKYRWVVTCLSQYFSVL